MTSKSELRERVRKVEALRRGAVTEGERKAAEAALARLQAKLDEPRHPDRPGATLHFSMSSHIPSFPGGFPGSWPVQIFMSLCVVAMASGLAVMRGSASRRP
ncbi:hypothetical protein M2320_000848 [Rhodoblastus acidophilus]|nr:hypothetical protein [Rhodoblastus acidophilus]